MISAVDEVAVNIIGNKGMFTNGSKVIGVPHQSMMNNHGSVFFGEVFEILERNGEDALLISKHNYF